MTLLHLITRLSLGGSARNTMDSAAAAARAGYRTLLAAGPSGDEHDMAGAAREKGCEVLLVPSFRRQISPVHDVLALLQTASLIRRESVDIVHTHTSKAGFIGRLAARLCRAPVVIHTPHGHIFHSYYGPALTRWFILLERWAAHGTDRIVVLTRRGAEEHLARGIGRPGQFVVIPSGVDIEGLRAAAPSRQEARARLGWKDRDLFIVGLGRLVPVKGFDLAVRAMPEVLRHVPEARLVLVGDGPERHRLLTLAEEQGLGDRLIVAGASEAVYSYLAAADVVLAPSRNEGMGRAIVEAMALGAPIVACRVGGIPEVVSDGVCGLLVPPEDPPALARSLIELAREPSRRIAYGNAGVQQAELFSLSRMNSLLLKLYRDAASDKGLAVPEESTPGTRG